MVNKKISQLEEKTDLLLDDEFPFIRKQGNNHINYKVKKSTVITSLNDIALAYSIALG